jgi:hypothetical protein
MYASLEAVISTQELHDGTSALRHQMRRDAAMLSARSTRSSHVMDLLTLGELVPQYPA